MQTVNGRSGTRVISEKWLRASLCRLCVPLLGFILVKFEGFILGVVAHPVVDEDEGSHRFDDGDGARYDAWIVPAAADEFGFLAMDGDCFLLLQDGRGGFEGDAKEEFLAVGYAALDSAGIVGLCADGSVSVFEEIVVFGAGEIGPGKSAPDFESPWWRGGRAWLWPDRLRGGRKPVLPVRWEDCARDNECFHRLNCRFSSLL